MASGAGDAHLDAVLAGTSAAADRASSCASPRSRCGTSPTARIRRVMRLTDRDSVRVGDDARDVGRRRPAPARGRACAKNSMLPSAPRNGDVDQRAHTEPERVEPGDDLAQHRVVHDRVAHDAALADPRPARLELRLHEQHELGVGGGRARAGSARPCATR